MRRLIVFLAALCLAGWSHAQCVTGSTWTSTPPLPTTGTIPGGETFEICFTLSGWNTVSANWFHSVTYDFGPGWDPASITPTLTATSLSGSGTWAWHPPVITGSCSGYGSGPGFYYEQGSGSACPTGPTGPDANPGNNWGDNGTGSSTNWNFCVQVTTRSGAACVDGADLGFSIFANPDGLTGGYTNAACNAQPPAINFSGPTLSCCDSAFTLGIDPLCPGESSGSIMATGYVAGSYTFTLDGVSLTTTGTADTAFFTGLPAGTYTLNIVDPTGCSIDQTLILTEPPAITFSLDSLVDVACPGGATGQFGVTAFGGSTGLGTFTYSLDGGPDQPIGFFDGLAAGTYTVTARDGNGCTKDTTITLIEDNLLELVVVDVTDALCHGDATGAITLSASGGTPPYTFSADGATYLPGPVLGGLPGGDYTVSVQDATGCVVTAGATVGQPEPLTLDAGTYLPIPSGGDVVLEPVTNADPVASWAWSPADFLSCSDCPNPVSQPDATIWYTLTVTDGNGCTATDSTRIVVVESLAIPNAFTPNADGLNDVFRVQPAYAESFTLRVFNRWGEAVFVSFDPAQGWDGTLRGKEQESGTYLYAVSYVNESGETITRQGTLTLLR